MKSTGIVRKVDELGRVVIPKEIRDNFNLEYKTPMEIFIDEGTIILKKYATSNECIFCGNCKQIVTFKDKKICLDCFNQLSE